MREEVYLSQVKELKEAFKNNEEDQFASTNINPADLTEEEQLALVMELSKKEAEKEKFTNP